MMRHSQFGKSREIHTIFSGLSLNYIYLCGVVYRYASTEATSNQTLTEATQKASPDPKVTSKSTKQFRKRNMRKKNSNMDNSRNSFVSKVTKRFKYLFTRPESRYEFIKGIPSKSEVFVGKVSVYYAPKFDKLWKTLVSYVLANFQFNHEKRRDISTELNMHGVSSRVQVAKKLGKALFERSLACAEYYVNNVFTDYDHRIVGLSGKVKLPLLFLRFCGILDQNRKSEMIPGSKSYLFISPSGYELPDEIETNKKPKNYSKLLKSKKVKATDIFTRPRLKIQSPSDFLEQLVLLRNLCDIWDPTLNIDFDIQDQKPDNVSFLSCLTSEKDGKFEITLSDNHASELDICESVLFQPTYDISGVPNHVKGNITYNVDSEMIDYLGLRYWEAVFGEKGITSTSRLEVSSVESSSTKAHSLLNVQEQIISGSGTSRE